MAEDSAFAVLDAIYQDRVTYEEVRSLFIGLFSRTPNNAIATNYTEIRTDIIEQFYKEDPNGENTFDVLFRIHRVTEEAAQKIQELSRDESEDLFQRFWKDDTPNYRAFLASSCPRNHFSR